MDLNIRRIRRAMTMVELLVVVAVLAIIALLAAPAMNDLIGMQRLRAINDQLVTDIQYMRSEAVSRNQFMGFTVRNDTSESMSCYVIFSESSQPLNKNMLDPAACTCTNALGAVCTGTQRELRTVQVPRDLSISLRVQTTQPALLIISPVTGGAEFKPTDTFQISGLEFCVEVSRTPRGRLRTGISPAGRTTICSPDSSVPGVPACTPYDAAVQNCDILS